MLRNKYFIIFILFVFAVFFLLSNFLKKAFEISMLKTIFGIEGLRKIDNKTTFLVLGIPGGKHDGPTLSDSIMVINYNFKKNKAYVLSIPRDIWSDTLKDRINTAFAYGETQKKHGGLILAKAEIGAIVGMPIQYAVVVNFSSFKDLIDFIGGIDINIESSFVDRKYPIEGKENDECDGDKEFKCRYETVKFKKGIMHMSGDTALKFVRSRNAEGGEGSDFARTKRQQLALESLQRALVKETNIFNPKKIKTIYEKINISVQRDFTNQQISQIAKNIIFKGKLKQIKFTIPRDYFFSPLYLSYDGKYVLVPLNNDYKDIHEYISCVFEDLGKRCQKTE